MSQLVNSTYRVSLLTANGTRMTMSIIAAANNPDDAYEETRRKLGLSPSEEFVEWNAHEFLPGDVTMEYTIRDVTTLTVADKCTTPLTKSLAYKDFPVALTL